MRCNKDDNPLLTFLQAAANCRAAEEELDSVQAVNDTMFRYVRLSAAILQTPLCGKPATRACLLACSIKAQHHSADKHRADADSFLDCCHCNLQQWVLWVPSP